MFENEETMNNLAETVTLLVEELAQCRKRALEIELQLSTIDEALKSVREPRPVGKPRGRPRKVPVAEIYNSLEAVEAEDFGGNAVA